MACSTSLQNKCKLACPAGTLRSCLFQDTTILLLGLLHYTHIVHYSSMYRTFLWIGAHHCSWRAGIKLHQPQHTWQWPTCVVEHGQYYEHCRKLPHVTKPHARSHRNAHGSNDIPDTYALPFNLQILEKMLKLCVREEYIQGTVQNSSSFSFF
jgi:hypothetical protein